ncbi:hypothetical protein [Ketobacter sp.]|uniref:hypothetical protein n=1 Tax=Ketobacter sp. TaxID=2083498 RepID=UPI0025C10622|nr:hypothetical protein [Ketobacter sp.]
MKHSRLRFILMPVLVTALMACSSKGTYEAIQNGQKNDCQKYYGDEYDKCIEPYSKPYEDYERDRDALLE